MTKFLMRNLEKKGFKEKKQKRFGIKGILKPSKFIKIKYEEDKINLISYYNSLGFRDARIVSDSVWRNDKGFNINVKLNEGKNITSVISISLEILLILQKFCKNY